MGVKNYMKSIVGKRDGQTASPKKAKTIREKVNKVVQKAGGTAAGVMLGLGVMGASLGVGNAVGNRQDLENEKRNELRAEGIPEAEVNKRVDDFMQSYAESVLGFTSIIGAAAASGVGTWVGSEIHDKLASRRKEEGEENTPEKDR
ncbi:MAG: hypothetical protein LBM01_03865 [Christensenellaceae bacterium]|jgi:hypothetical protein|nr:hypothetical protein [Christensenellaceae bacterium]